LQELFCPHSAQVHHGIFLPKEWIMAKWDEGYYITALAGSDNMSSLLVMSKGSKFTQQSYKVGEREDLGSWGNASAQVVSEL
jgi:hypothetical protein